MRREIETCVEFKHEIDEIGIEPTRRKRVFCLDSLASAIVTAFPADLFTQRTSLISFFCELF